jgi:hypothetical protein
MSENAPAGFDPSPLRIERGEAWAELRRGDGGEVVLEMRDPSHHWVAPVGDTVLTVGGWEWWFLAGRLSGDARSVEFVSGGERYGAELHASCWLVALPRDAGVAGGRLVATDPWGEQLVMIELGMVANPPPRPAVPRVELGSRRAPVTLRFDVGPDLKGWIAGIGLMLGLAGVNFALGEPAYASFSLVVALLIALAFLMRLLPGAYDLHLERDGFMWRSFCRTSRFRWSDVVDFRPIGRNLSDVGFDLAEGRGIPVSARMFAGLSGADRHLPPNTYGLSAVQLAALMNAWREDHLDREVRGSAARS